MAGWGQGTELEWPVLQPQPLRFHTAPCLVLSLGLCPALVPCPAQHATGPPSRPGLGPTGSLGTGHPFRAVLFLCLCSETREELIFILIQK